MYICVFGHLIHSALLRKLELWHDNPYTRGAQVWEVSESGGGFDDRGLLYIYFLPGLPYCEGPWLSCVACRQIAARRFAAIVCMKLMALV